MRSPPGRPALLSRGRGAAPPPGPPPDPGKVGCERRTQSQCGCDRRRHLRTYMRGGYQLTQLGVGCGPPHRESAAGALGPGPAGRPTGARRGEVHEIPPSTGKRPSLGNSGERHVRDTRDRGRCLPTHHRVQVRGSCRTPPGRARGTRPGARVQRLPPAAARDGRSRVRAP